MRYQFGVLAILVVITLLAGGMRLSPVEASPLSAPASTTSAGCAIMNDPELDAVYGISPWISTQFFAGETLIIKGTLGYHLAGTILVLVIRDDSDNVLAEIHDNEGPLLYSVQFTFETNAVVKLFWQETAKRNFTWDVSCISPSEMDPDMGALPGSDMVTLPDTAVSGKFVSTTALYWAPKPGAVTDAVMKAGQTLWVLGVDSTGQYYQVVLSGKYLWVPVWTMAPNPDQVWLSHPLPTTVVD